MKFQAPKGTRDFYPEEMAWRRFLEDHWRAASIRNGFEEVEGPIFERLDLYRVKSGDEIVKDLFHVTRPGGKTTFAIRPEFTPTLARMVAAKAASLPRPIKWFCLPNLCRGEQPQRGRLREFLQWNIDMLGLDDAVADAEVIFTCVDVLRALGLEPRHVKVKISHREVVKHILNRLGVADEHMLEAFNLLDRRDKMSGEQFAEQAAKLGLDPATVERFNQVVRVRHSANEPWEAVRSVFSVPEQDMEDLHALHTQLKAFGIADWCEYDLGIVRGLAYYTGTVFEVHEVSGAERAIAGGGRYDRLIKLMGGPEMPAVGFGMGDVVLSLVLADKGLLPESVMPGVDAFVFAASDAAQGRVPVVVASLREAGLHARMTYRATTNVGKLLKEASASRARFAVILDDQTVHEQVVGLKDLETGEQQAVADDELAERIAQGGHAPLSGRG